jgi:S-adenosylmethionine:tRNA ribosyltransferase-isomerase
MMTGKAGIRHGRFSDLEGQLDPGDLVVVNDSTTLPASVVIDGDLVVHFSTRQPGGFYVVEPRRLAGPASDPWTGPPPRVVRFEGGSIELLAPFPASSESPRLWISQIDIDGSYHNFLARWGRPIRYRHVSCPVPLTEYQTLFASVPGSAEMPSAARPFTAELVTRLVRSGVAIANLTLHTGVSSLDTGEAPYSEWFEVPEHTAALVNQTHANGHRVIAVGTTVVRALESAVDSRGLVHPMRSWADLVIGPGHELLSVDGLVTGWHEPKSTHLSLLEAFAGRSLLVDSYASALQDGYLWHEFGDSHLILRD